MFKMNILLTFSFTTSVHACLNLQVSERQKIFGKYLEEIRIAIGHVIPHTFVKGDAFCEVGVKNTKRPKSCPNFSVWEKGMGKWIY